MLHISFMMSDGHSLPPKEKKPVPHKSPLDASLAELGHSIITGDDGWQEYADAAVRKEDSSDVRYY